MSVPNASVSLQAVKIVHESSDSSISVSRFNDPRENWPTWKAKIYMTLQDKNHESISAKCTTSENSNELALLASLLFNSMIDKALRPFASHRSEFLKKGVEMWGDAPFLV